MDLGQHQVFILPVPSFFTHTALFCSIHSCDYGRTKRIPEGMFKLLVIQFKAYQLQKILQIQLNMPNMPSFQD